MNIIITGGGTGGHINPALAIGKKLQKAFPYAKLLYVGGKREPALNIPTFRSWGLIATSKASDIIFGR